LQQRALPGAGHHGSQAGVDGVELAQRVGLLQEVDLFLGKVERGLHQHAQPHGALAQGLDLLRERAAE
jgi:hypothetical protein